ncbi:formyltetrahydrofolate deformylase [Peredibacter starrii]|uniref:Formyltetrahydrofolate deformylase n=1 Tax=Peredibacter starrii TaxID=28202 RepID=A0AAX4HMG7_9BACT|nr:formyltetrahydrofolate deformylase [Peredibacter starrii]WPU64358.1 formyltetrahydrofolate deformylase [Peredibacter starrii]
MNHVLLINSRDQKGLISKISTILYQNDLNIVEMKEHVDRASDTFYMRCEFTGDGNIEAIKDKIKKELPANAQLTLNPKKKKDVVILATKEHHCLSDILIRHYFSELDIEIKCVIANHTNLKELVNKFGIEFVHISHENKTKEAFEQEILDYTKKFNPDYLVLAKFMRILSSNFVKHYPNKIINIHHSFLPAFIGANPYRQAYERGIKIIGATSHFVTDELDQGPIISQKTIQVDHSFSAEDMKKAGRDTERLALAEALNHAIDDRIFVMGNKTVILT